MRERVTGDDINTAVEIMSGRIQRWKDEHPGEKLPLLCKYCENTGLIRRVYDEDGVELHGVDRFKPGAYDYYYPCRCVSTQDNQLLKNNKKFSSVPRLYKDANFENFNPQIYRNMESKQLGSMALTQAKGYVGKFGVFEEHGFGLYLYSEARGCGKTRLASTIANELTAKGIRVKFESAGRILSEIQKTWDDKNVSETTILKKYIEPRLLIIDDFGARSGKDWMDEKFLMIIDARYQDSKPTIFTSNYEIEQLPFNDMRIIDRLSDVDRFYSIRMPKESVRQKARLATGETSLFYKILGGEE